MNDPAFQFKERDFKKEKVLVRRLCASLNRLSKLIDDHDERMEIKLSEVTDYLAQLDDCYIFVTDMLEEYTSIQAQLLTDLSNLSIRLQTC